MSSIHKKLSYRFNPRKSARIVHDTRLIIDREVLLAAASAQSFLRLEIKERMPANGISRAINYDVGYFDDASKRLAFRGLKIMSKIMALSLIRGGYDNVPPEELLPYLTAVAKLTGMNVDIATLDIVYSQVQEHMSHLSFMNAPTMSHSYPFFYLYDVRGTHGDTVRADRYKVFY